MAALCGQQSPDRNRSIPSNPQANTTLWVRRRKGTQYILPSAVRQPKRNVATVQSRRYAALVRKQGVRMAGVLKDPRNANRLALALCILAICVGRNGGGKTYGWSIAALL